MWRDLWAGSVIYILFESISLFFILATIVTLIHDLRKGSSYLWLSVLFIWNALSWHFFAFVIWSGLAIMYFDDDCDSLTWNEGKNQAKTCGEEGPAIALATVLWLFLIVIFYTCIYCSIRKQTQGLEPKEKEVSDVKISEAADTPEDNDVDEGNTKRHKHRHRHHHRDGRIDEVEGNKA